MEYNWEKILAEQLYSFLILLMELFPYLILLRIAYLKYVIQIVNNCYSTHKFNNENFKSQKEYWYDNCNELSINYSFL